MPIYQTEVTLNIQASNEEEAARMAQNAMNDANDQWYGGNEIEFISVDRVIERG